MYLGGQRFSAKSIYSCDSNLQYILDHNQLNKFRFVKTFITIPTISASIVAIVSVSTNHTSFKKINNK